jgi:UDP-4-amino-4,6-dideoxy-N-acetyl-beta-L-altrosamine transaminase
MKINYGKQTIAQKDIKAVTEVLKSDYLTTGPKIKEFENKLSFLMGSKYSVVVSNGTAALHLVGLVENWSKNDIILTTPISFLASANCVIYNNAKIDFVDVTNDTYTIDPKKLEKKILKINKKKLRAVIAVDYAGHPCDWKNLKKLSRKYNFKLINDNCHAIGAKYYNQISYAIKYADYVTHSYHPVKNITSAEGGAIFTNDKNKYKKLKILRNHGMIKNKDKLSYKMNELGYNYRLSDVQCALGISQLSRLNSFIAKRRKIARTYTNFLKKYNFIKLPIEKGNCFHAYHLYPILIDFNQLKISRKRLIKKLNQENIFPQIHYFPIHLQPFYKKKFGFKKGDFKIAEGFYKKEISLPIYPDLNLKRQNKVLKVLKKSLLNNLKH